MKATFNNIREEKRIIIYKAAVSEFSKHSFEGSSLNQIIATAGISKGGMYKYIEGKDDLYSYIIEKIFRGVTTHQTDYFDSGISCYFQRIKSVLIDGIAYYTDHRNEFKMMMNALSDTTSSQYANVLSIRSACVAGFESTLLEGVDWHQYSMSKEEIIKIAQYIIGGYNTQLIHYFKSDQTVENFEAQLIDNLDLIINSIMYGVKE